MSLAANNVKLTLSYDGNNFLGWQKTSMGRSVEEELQKVLEQILQEPIQLQAASRTDAGVHALGQVVNFYTKKEELPLSKLKISLNSLLPKDIAVLELETAPANFHPTLDCIGKEYHYHLCYGSTQIPMHRFYSWHYPHKLNLQLMRQASSYFLGTHDFSSFCNYKKNSNYVHHERTINSIEFVELPQDRLRIEIRGNSFLYKMVRNLVGTLAYVGCGKIPLEHIPTILKKKDRTLAGMTAPAHGLCLYEVFYTPDCAPNLA